MPAVSFADDIVAHLIDRHTYEGGVRKIKELLVEVCRNLNEADLVGTVTLANRSRRKAVPYAVTREQVDAYLEHKTPALKERVHTTSIPGRINGLYASCGTDMGGIIQIETKLVPSNDTFGIVLTGNLGKVMKESATVAKTLALGHRTETHTRCEDPELRYAARCCGDVARSPPPPVTPPPPPFSYSDKACRDLEWEVSHDVQPAGRYGVCAHAEVDGECVTNVAWSVARDICDHYGARLCSRLELVAGRKVTGPNGRCRHLDESLFWTSDHCGADHHILGSVRSQDAVCVHSFEIEVGDVLRLEMNLEPEEHRAVLCCADDYPSPPTPPSPPPSPPAPPPPPENPSLPSAPFPTPPPPAGPSATAVMPPAGSSPAWCGWHLLRV